MFLDADSLNNYYFDKVAEKIAVLLNTPGWFISFIININKIDQCNLLIKHLKSVPLIKDLDLIKKLIEPGKDEIVEYYEGIQNGIIKHTYRKNKFINFSHYEMLYGKICHKWNEINTCDRVCK